MSPLHPTHVSSSSDSCPHEEATRVSSSSDSCLLFILYAALCRRILTHTDLLSVDNSAFELMSVLRDVQGHPLDQYRHVFVLREPHLHTHDVTIRQHACAYASIREHTSRHPFEDASVAV